MLLVVRSNGLCRACRGGGIARAVGPGEHPKLSPGGFPSPIFSLLPGRPGSTRAVPPRRWLSPAPWWDEQSTGPCIVRVRSGGSFASPGSARRLPGMAPL